MSHQPFLLQWANRGGSEFQVLPEFATYRWSKPRDRSQAREIVPDAFGITEGEDIGINDIPLGSGTVYPGLPRGLDRPGTFLPSLSIPEIVRAAQEATPRSATPTPVRDIPGGIYETGRAPDTDWDQTYEDFVVLNPDLSYPDLYEPNIEEPVMADTSLWDIGRGIIDIFDDSPSGAPMAPPQAYGPPNLFPGGAPPATGPARVTVDTRTGQVRPCGRRRRRRLLTPTDLSDLAALQAIVGKGDALKLAVAKAVRR